MASYTVVIVPLRNGLTSLDAVHFFLWVKKLKDLEREKDLLWMGLHALEQVRERLCSKLEDNSSKKEMRKVLQEFPDTPTLLLAQIHRVNRALRNLLCDSRNPTNPAQGRPSMEGTDGHLPSPACSEESACF